MGESGEAKPECAEEENSAVAEHDEKSQQGMPDNDKLEAADGTVASKSDAANVTTDEQSDATIDKPVDNLLAADDKAGADASAIDKSALKEDPAVKDADPTHTDQM